VKTVRLILVFILLFPLITIANFSIDDLIIRANEGDSNAQYQLGELYLLGSYGVKYNISKARKWFLLASSLGNPAADFNLAYIYYVGTGVKKDLKAAFDYYKLSASKGYSKAENNLGVFYRDGIGTKRNIDLAFINFKRAADKGYSIAQYNLGKLYYNAPGNFPRDYREAAYWFQQAADLGNAKSQTMLAEMYKKGTGVKKDLKKSLFWYKKAGKQLEYRSSLYLKEIGIE